MYLWNASVMRKGILLGLGAGLLVLSSCGNSKPTLVQVICVDRGTDPYKRHIAYFWSDGSSDYYGSMITSTKGTFCPAGARSSDIDNHYHFDYPPKP